MGLYERIAPHLPPSQKSRPSTVVDSSLVQPGMIVTLNIPDCGEGNTLGLVVTTSDTTAVVAAIVAPDMTLATTRDICVPVRFPSESQPSGLTVVVAVDIVASLAKNRLAGAKLLGFAPDDTHLLTLIMWGHQDSEESLTNSAHSAGYATGLNAISDTELARRTKIVRALAAAAWADLDD